jgi:multiple sugar transport system substrate-binding protein
MTEHPNVKVVWDTAPSSQDLQKQLVMAATGTSGDSFWNCITCSWAQLQRAGMFVDHAPLAKASNFSWDGLLPQVVAGVTIDGKIYGIPNATHPGYPAVVINKTMFDKAGVPVPAMDWTNDPHPGLKNWTFDDLQNAAIKLTKRDGGRTSQFGYDLNGSSSAFWMFIDAIRSMGGDYLTPDGTKVLYDTPEGRGAIGFYADLQNKYKVATTPQDTPAGAPDLMASGRVAIRAAPVWAISTAKNLFKTFEWQILPGPRGKNGSDGYFEWNSFSVLKTSKHPDITFDFLTRVVTPDVERKVQSLGGIPGTHKVIWEDPTFLNDPSYGVFAKMVKTCSGTLIPANGRVSEFEDAGTKALDPMFTGQASDVSQLIKDFTPQLQAILDKPAAGLQSADCSTCSGGML